MTESMDLVEAAAHWARRVLKRVTKECNRGDHDDCLNGQCECACHLTEPEQFDGEA